MADQVPLSPIFTDVGDIDTFDTTTQLEEDGLVQDNHEYAEAMKADAFASRKKWFWIGLIVCGILLIIVVIVVLTQSGSDKITPKDIVDRFLDYVSYDTASDDNSTTSPSTDKQMNLAHHLVHELENLQLTNIQLSDYGVVTATLPASDDAKDAVTLGLIAHMDTYGGVSGANVNPQFKTVSMTNIQDILLDSGDTIYATSIETAVSGAPYDEFNLIYTDGSTLLGCDDKCGIAAIMEFLQRVQTDTGRTCATTESGSCTIRHPRIRVAFTPDEEIGRGVDHLSTSTFNADLAYTIDGGAYAQYEDACFNGITATISIDGYSVHTGDAKAEGLKNSAQPASFAAYILDNHDKLQEYPHEAYNSDGTEPYVHVDTITGAVASSEVSILVRGFTNADVASMEDLVTQAVEDTRIAFPDYDCSAANKNACIHDASFDVMYQNMHDVIAAYPDIETVSKTAMENAGISEDAINANSHPIRGGTDGARLAYADPPLPTPNLFTGGGNFHSVTEFAVVESMEAVADVMEQLAEEWSYRTAI
ncbi:putative multi-domain containing protein [Aduncisulcus paluster]|uniref:Multi-domain containing protein n=1 Tax=Aduncisulcus paluster TaxID=2918883 RepID=A0ABQ5KUH0_9EUKA|nr:putative multi-domain containing protein [Aduncisulcus paluster]|eukprot:gnl/Carplike_NY0171/410_a565_1287.p1 GENE.gnl/Carplike_NY0171/410_a565_1287~~gnl/Carplike_NY0171/410_a565_1287.p1  ORF type:complete len:535 (+),score=160.24 gnl/Carplike_NY0171/410_a565_1287:60-1664(+)